MISSILLGLAVGSSIAATATSVLLHKRINVIISETRRLDMTIAAMSDHIREGQCEIADSIDDVAKKTGDAVKKEVLNMAFTGIKLYH